VRGTCGTTPTKAMSEKTIAAPTIARANACRFVLRRARADHARHGRDQGASIFAEMVRWMEQYGPALKTSG